MMTLQEWINNYLLEDTIAGLRVGQSYMVRVHPKMSNLKLFNETNVQDAWNMIYQIEEDYQQ